MGQAKVLQETVQKTYDIQMLIKSPLQMMFFVFILSIICSLVPFFNWGYQWRKKALAEAPEGYNFPKMADFSLTAKATLVLLVAEYLCRNYLYKCFYGICKEQDDLKMRDLRCKKAAAHVYKTIYFAMSVGLGYYIMLDSHYLHKYYGGKAEHFSRDGMAGHPYIDRTENPYV